MPIEPKRPLRRLSQDEFGEVAYEVMGAAFDVHDRLGRLLKEHIYQNALKNRFGERVDVEFPVRVWHRDFETHYCLDLVVDQAAVFELKTVASLTDQHRSQLMNYLMLTETAHGKLINFQATRVEHEFVNTSLDLEQRREFSVKMDRWDRRPEGSQLLEDTVLRLLKDWGTGLALPLYQQALAHLLGGQERGNRSIEIRVDDATCGEIEIQLLNPNTALWVSGVKPADQALLETHIRRFLNHTSLVCVQWLNITLNSVRFQTVANT
jgi:GxxExxY protein